MKLDEWEIDVEFIATGKVRVIAPNKTRAREIVQHDFWGIVDNYSNSGNDDSIPDWEMETHLEQKQGNVVMIKHNVTVKGIND